MRPCLRIKQQEVRREGGKRGRREGEREEGEQEKTNMSSLLDGCWKLLHPDALSPAV